MMGVPDYTLFEALRIQNAAISRLDSYSDDRHYYSDRLLGEIIGVPTKHMRFLLMPFVFDARTNPDGSLETMTSERVYRFGPFEMKNISVSYRIRSAKAATPAALQEAPRCRAE